LVTFRTARNGFDGCLYQGLFYLHQINNSAIRNVMDSIPVIYHIVFLWCLR